MQTKEQAKDTIKAFVERKKALTAYQNEIDEVTQGVTALQSKPLEKRTLSDDVELKNKKNQLDLAKTSLAKKQTAYNIDFNKFKLHLSSFVRNQVQADLLNNKELKEREKEIISKANELDQLKVDYKEIYDDEVDALIMEYVEAGYRKLASGLPTHKLGIKQAETHLAELIAER